MAAAALLTLIGGLGAMVARETGGRFAYALDDPYIHLALAEEVARGHYGVNPAQAASPSSSALWPVLLAPLARTPLGLLWPLVLNVLCGAAVAAIAARVTWDALGVGPRREVVAATMGFIVAFLANVPTLVFIGMEHTLHVALAALVVLGLVREAQAGKVEWWLVAALITGPIVRYEHLALTMPALVYLWRRGHRRPALVAGGAALASLAAFSAFLSAQGLPMLPTSVIAKLPAARYGGALLGPVTGFAANMIHERGRLLLLFGAGFCVFALTRPSGTTRPERALAAWGASALGLHLLFGDVGWLARYEAYAMVVALLLSIALFGPIIARLVRERIPLRAGILALAVTLGLGMESLQAMLRVPGGAADVLLQPCEVRRFVVDYWRSSVGVNDLGCVAYRNDNVVLDLWGLASERALSARRAGGVAWMDALAEESDVGLIIIHPEMFAGRVPGGWTVLGDLDLGRPLSVLAARRVRFYARDNESAQRARPLLREWAAGLPAPARFISQPPREAGLADLPEHDRRVVAAEPEGIGHGDVYRP